MDATPRLSILVATWNCAHQLEQFLESLLAQSWTDWECLLLDNASTDGTAELVAELQERFPVATSIDPDFNFDTVSARYDREQDGEALVEEICDALSEIMTTP